MTSEQTSKAMAEIYDIRRGLSAVKATLLDAEQAMAGRLVEAMKLPPAGIPTEGQVSGDGTTKRVNVPRKAIDELAESFKTSQRRRREIEQKKQQTLDARIARLRASGMSVDEVKAKLNITKSRIDEAQRRLRKAKLQEELSWSSN